MPEAKKAEKEISYSDLDDITEVIDFNELQIKQNKLLKNEKKEEETVSEKDEENENDEDENMFTSEDPTRMFQYHLTTVTYSPTGIPEESKYLLWSKSEWYIKLRSQFLISHIENVQCGLIRGFYGLHQERFRHMLTHPYIIHPHSNFSLGWNLFIGIYTAGILIYAPFMITFKPIEYFYGSFTFLSLYGSMILILDMGFQFITGITDKFSRNVILDPEKIAMRYLKGWFAFDIITRFPLDYILFYLLPKEDHHVIGKLGGLRVLAYVLRIMRYRQVFCLLSLLSQIFAFKGIIAPWLLKLVTLILFTIHWHACFHFLMPDIINVNLINPKPYSWVTGFNLWEKPWWHKYISSYLRSLSNVLTLDGGDIIPREPEEILCTCIGICLSVSLLGYFISSFSTIVSQNNISQDTYNGMLDLVEEYLLFQKVPEKFRQRVLLYFEKKYMRHVFSDAVLLATLSPSLRTEMTCHNCRKLVENVPMFKKLPKSVIVGIVQRLKYEVYVPGDVLIAQNSIADYMYFIQDGEVEIFSNYGTRTITLVDGNYFGEISLITGERRMKSAVAKTPCQVYILSKKDFTECVEICPEIYKEILATAKNRLEADHNAAQEAAKKRDELNNWKDSKKILDKGVEAETQYHLDVSGIDFVEGEDQSSSENEDEDGESLKTAKQSRIEETAQGKTVQRLLRNVKDLAKGLKKGK